MLDSNRNLKLCTIFLYFINLDFQRYSTPNTTTPHYIHIIYRQHHYVKSQYLVVNYLYVHMISHIFYIFSKCIHYSS